MKIRWLESLLNRIRLAWIGLVSKIKGVFSRNNKNDVPSANDNTESQEEVQAGNLEGTQQPEQNKIVEEDDVVSELDEEEELEEEWQGVLAGLDMVESAWSELISKAQSLFPLGNKEELHQYEEVDVLPGREMLQSAWSWVTLQAQRLFSLSNEEETQNRVVENIKNNRDNSGPKQDEGNAVKNVEKNMHAQVIYANDKFYSAKNNLQEAGELTDHENTFAIALYDLKIIKHPDAGVSPDSGIFNKLTGLQFIDGKCVVKLVQGNGESSHIRLFTPCFFGKHRQESVDDLLQYTDKEGKTHSPDFVMLLDKSDNINLEPTNLGWGVSRAWSYIKASEAEKSTRITPTLFPTFEIELSEEQGKQTLNFVLKQAAVPDIMEDLKKEKPTLRRILAIPFSKGFIMSWVNSILDAVMIAPKGTNGEKVTNFHLRDVFMNGTILNESQKQTNAELNGQQRAAENSDQQHTQAENLDTQVKHAHIERAGEGRVH